jgi:cytochrome b6-f complex iron-sulfur subunit
MDRRKFLGWVGMGFLATSLPVAIAACNKETNPSEPTTSTEKLPEPPTPNSNQNGAYIAIGAVEKLDQDGQILNEEKEVIIIREPESKNLVALSAKCTHKGCLVNWKADEKQFVCPCHDALFKASGEVIEGPAKEPLAVYPVKEDNGQILVEITV